MNNSLLKPTIRIAIVTVIILLIPLVTMQFTDEVNWDHTDFIVAGILISGTGISYLFISRKIKSDVFRSAVTLALVGMFLLTWVNGAVGIIGSENNDINMYYGFVIVAGIIGGLISRFQPLGLSLTAFAMAIVQSLIAITALMTGMYHDPYSSITEILVLNGFFVGLFVWSGLLFQKATK